jgi:hypothetical protein
MKSSREVTASGSKCERRNCPGLFNKAPKKSEEYPPSDKFSTHEEGEYFDSVLVRTVEVLYRTMLTLFCCRLIDTFHLSRQLGLASFTRYTERRKTSIEVMNGGYTACGTVEEGSGYHGCK